MRKEYDAIGEIDVPDDAYYGAFTSRAMKNFPPSRKAHPHLIHALSDVKWACASANEELGLLDHNVASVIKRSCDEMKDLSKWFVIDPLSGGSGTALNMNINEIIANRSTELLGGRLGQYLVHPVDDVNKSQSTNDVYPTAIKLGAIRLLRELVDEVALLQESLQSKEKAFDNILKVGRTEMQDAVPITLGQEFGAYAEAIARDRWRLYKVEERIRFVNLGGTAIGTGINAPRTFSYVAIRYLSERTGLGLVRSENLIESTQNTDVFSEVHGLLKTLATNLIKISNDLRLLSSGPRAGIGEIKLKAVQAGSSIMAGKVNPVLPEYAIYLSMKVLSNDVAVNMAVSSGNLELNAFLPLIQYSLYDSFDSLIQAVHALRTCVDTLEADPDRCRENLEKSAMMATCFVPILGYEKVSKIVSEAIEKHEDVKKLLLDAGIPSEMIESAFDPKKMIALGYIPDKR
ncbi:aspartate ammonia-lyase [Athalassotoga saccharophila]|uniref:aspartate ammonia-lyase n=1 Tax=Athalassotoga saccharophila TaxID=1441386 RepID=UPI00137990C6|nr:aspartate ammonia-lyase [Athalassotoga saccharophila]BBJ28611.1 aspartate ammonia-lyase [Athalassotoga saccharophila]